MKKVLVIYYTQTGQLERAIKATLAPLEANPAVEVHYEYLQPEISYPYPWTYTRFFDLFPECVQGKPCALKPTAIDPAVDFDLIVLAYQPWFLSICIPVNSFLQSEQAQRLLKDKPVVTIIACRNMWLNAQEKMKKQLLQLGAKLEGNIVFADPSANLISLITVLAFILGGVQKRFLGIFPKYGVADEELKGKAPAYGNTVLKHLQEGDYAGMQTELNSAGAVQVKANLLLMEGRGKALFPIYADYISKKGRAGTSERKTRVRIFGIVLPLAILILSPIITIVSRLTPLLFASGMQREKNYYAQNGLR